MPDFASMSFDQLIAPEGYACPCGKVHKASLKYLKIGSGAVNCLPEALEKVGSKKPYVVCDKNTYEVAGKKVEEILTAAGIAYTLYVIPGGERIAPAEWELGSIGMHFDADCDLILGVGSGVINDLCKVAAHQAHLPCGIIGTAPSMDGFTSNSSSMEVNHVKLTLYFGGPVIVICDTDILAQAPMRMLWAGLGDMVAKYISVCEWRISALINGEYYCENVASLMRAALKKIMDHASGIKHREPAAIQAIAEGLVTAGLAMACAEVSRPASGLEHYFSHVWEMLALERNVPYDLHGIQVGVGTLLTMKIYDKLKTVTPDREKAIAAFRSLSHEEWEKNIRRIFGKTAGEILEIERKVKKNDPVRHEKRLNVIVEKWDEILKIIDEELPDSEFLESAMRDTGMPLLPRDIDIPDSDVADAFVGARDIRDKYLSCTLIWDLGLTGEFVDYLKEYLKNA